MKDDQIIKNIIRSDVSVSKSESKLKSKITKNEYAGTEINNLMTDCVKAGLDRGKSIGTVKTEIKYIKASDWDDVYPEGSLKD